LKEVLIKVTGKTNCYSPQLQAFLNRVCIGIDHGA